MRKAYDTFLQSEVSADLAAKSSGLEPYRYECAHCGEEVRLAAASSTSMVAHFRHLNGNNDVDCEKYLGQYGAISIDSRSRKSRNERAEFYFDSGTKMFYLGLCFSENEINTYEEESARFELRTTAQEQPFSSLRINNINFLPDTPRMIPIDQFSYSYHLSNTLNNVKRRYDFLKKDGLPTFFKIQGNDDYYRARLIRSKILYTDVSYFVVIEGQYSFSQSSCFLNNVEISDTCRFETMSRRVLGQVLTIKNKTADIDTLFASWGYQVETSETLTLLWPPSTQINEASAVYSENVFLFSSFSLEAHGNINVHSSDIQVLGSGVSKISVHSRVKVLRKNAEIIIDRDTKCPADYDPLPLRARQARVYAVSDDNTCFLFNRSGATLIGKGQLVSLTLGSFLKCYTSGYLHEVIYPTPQKELSGELLLNDLLAHYKRTEVFSLDSIVALGLSDTASRYIEKCIKTGVINSAAKWFIEEGRI